VPLYQDEVDKFLNDYWDYYEKLLYYKDNPTLEMAQSLSLEFDQFRPRYFAPFLTKFFGH
jgi:hypothetical protein